MNLSDLAACGATPLAFTLALALPRADDEFLAPFAQGLYALADAPRHRTRRRRHHRRAAEHLHHRVRRGAGRPARCCAAAHAPATTSGSAAAWATRGSRWRCSAARVALRRQRASRKCAAGDGMPRAARARWGWRCAAWPRSAIDLSDGLARRPAPRAARFGRGRHGGRRRRCRAAPCWPRSRRRCSTQCLLAGGDDYELLFTAPATRRDAVQAAGAPAGDAGHPHRPHRSRRRRCVRRRPRPAGWPWPCAASTTSA